MIWKIQIWEAHIQSPSLEKNCIHGATCLTTSNPPPKNWYCRSREMYEEPMNYISDAMVAGI